MKNQFHQIMLTSFIEKVARDMPSFTRQDRPEKVKEIYRALKRDHPNMPAEMKARIAARQGKPGKQKQGPPYKTPITKTAVTREDVFGTLATLYSPTGAGVISGATGGQERSLAAALSGMMHGHLRMKSYAPPRPTLDYIVSNLGSAAIGAIAHRMGRIAGLGLAKKKPDNQDKQASARALGIAIGGAGGLYSGYRSAKNEQDSKYLKSTAGGAAAGAGAGAAYEGVGALRDAVKRQSEISSHNVSVLNDAIAELKGKNPDTDAAAVSKKHFDRLIRKRVNFEKTVGLNALSGAKRGVGPGAAAALIGHAAGRYLGKSKTASKMLSKDYYAAKVSPKRQRDAERDSAREIGLMTGLLTTVGAFDPFHISNMITTKGYALKALGAGMATGLMANQYLNYRNAVNRREIAHLNRTHRKTAAFNIPFLLGLLGASKTPQAKLEKELGGETKAYKKLLKATKLKNNHALTGRVVTSRRAREGALVGGFAMPKDMVKRYKEDIPEMLGTPKKIVRRAAKGNKHLVEVEHGQGNIDIGAHEYGHASRFSDLLSRASMAIPGIGTFLGTQLARFPGTRKLAPLAVAAAQAPLLAEEARASILGDRSMRRLVEEEKIDKEIADEAISQSRKRLGLAYGSYLGGAGGAMFAAKRLGDFLTEIEKKKKALSGLRGLRLGGRAGLASGLATLGATALGSGMLSDVGN